MALKINGRKRNVTACVNVEALQRKYLMYILSLWLHFIVSDTPNCQSTYAGEETGISKIVVNGNLRIYRI